MALKVLLLFTSSQLGGAERSLTRMAVSAVGEVEYELATLDGNGPWVDWVRELGRLPLVLGKTNKDGAHGRFGGGAIWRVVELSRERKYDVIYVIGFRAAVALRVLRSALGRTKLVQGVRWNPDTGTRLDTVFRLVERLSGGLVDKYICNSRAAAQTLRERVRIDGEKISTISNGLLDIPPLVEAPRNATVAVVANLSPRKGHIAFLDAVEVVLKRIDVKFQFIGRDDMGGAVQAAISSRGLERSVECLGFVDNIGQHLSRAKVMALPSLWGEGSPTSVLEGFAYGLPVVAYAIDGLPELVENGRDGLLLPTRDTAAMAEALIKLLQSDHLRVSMGRAGHDKLRDHFSLAACAKKHAEVFQEVVGREP